MKKRVSLLVLTCSLLLSGIHVQAAEKQVLGLGKYFDFLVKEITGSKSDGDISSLMDSGEELLKNIKPEDAQKLIDFVEKQLQDGKWESEKGIEEAIAEGEKEFGVTLTKEQKEMVLSVVSKIKELGIAPEFVLEQAEKLYKKYGKQLAEESTNAVKEKGKDIIEDTQSKIKEEVSKSIADYFSDMIENVKTFFKGIFSR